MSRWHDMTVEEQVEAIRAGYIAGQSAAVIGAALGTTRNAVLGRAWKLCITPANAAVWAWESAEERIEDRRLHILEDNRSRRYERRLPPRLPIKDKMAEVKKRRRNLPNKAKDAVTRAAIAKINALEKPDHEIAKVMGVTAGMITSWRQGQHKMSATSLSLVDETVARLS